ncbi:MAG TPA: GNAT family protein [Candidatus Angelobacter sp.]|nr:GNAT family protein [Candidatus Angelobacter sp.]
MPLISADWPVPISPGFLQGRIIRLEPLASSHETELLKIADDEQIWRYLSSDARTPRSMHDYVNAALRDHLAGTALPFVVRASLDGRVIGMTRLKSMSRENRKAMVGSWFERSAWGSGANTESKLLLLQFAFESLHCFRVEFQTDSRNLRSRSALAKMGAFEEGTLRSYLITTAGHRRDTVVFSVLDREWPEMKHKLLGRLATNILDLHSWEEPGSGSFANWAVISSDLDVDSRLRHEWFP